MSFQKPCCLDPDRQCSVQEQKIPKMQHVIGLLLWPDVQSHKQAAIAESRRPTRVLSVWATLVVITLVQWERINIKVLWRMPAYPLRKLPLRVSRAQRSWRLTGRCHHRESTPNSCTQRAGHSRGNDISAMGAHQQQGSVAHAGLQMSRSARRIAAGARNNRKRRRSRNV